MLIKEFQVYGNHKMVVATTTAQQYIWRFEKLDLTNNLYPL